jgi:hypothetical protein
LFHHLPVQMLNIYFRYQLKKQQSY